VGAALAVCGAVMQGLFRNPMASPEILGISSGSSLGAVIAITTGAASGAAFVLPVFAAVGALCAALAIGLVSRRRGGTSLLYVVLAGMAISSLFNGIVSALLLFSNTYEIGQFVFWTMGGMEGRTWRHLALALPALVPALVVLYAHSRELNLFSLGEDHAHALGMHVDRTKLLLLGSSAVATAMCISVAGPIGFVGLLMPHVVRLLVGPDHRMLLPAASLAGALFLVLCDLVGRVLIAPLEIRAGILTALCGSPYFLYLILRSERKGSPFR
jgi:iron complex transport system permease protein